MSYVFVGLLLSFVKSIFLFGIETGGYRERLDINEQKTSGNVEYGCYVNIFLRQPNPYNFFIHYYYEKKTLAENFFLVDPKVKPSKIAKLVLI